MGVALCPAARVDGVGAIGIAIGYAMLLLAPGQAVRYAGVAAGNHPFHTMVDRGIAGNLKFIGDYVVEIGPGLLLVIATMLYAIRRRGAEVAAKLDRASALRMALAIAAALAIVVTTFASPIVEDRLFFAPCLVTVIGLAIAIAVPFAESRARVVLIGASIAVIAIDIVGFVAVYRDLADQTAHRMDTRSRPHRPTPRSPSSRPRRGGAITGATARICRTRTCAR